MVDWMNGLVIIWRAKNPIEPTWDPIWIADGSKGRVTSGRGGYRAANDDRLMSGWLA